MEYQSLSKSDKKIIRELHDLGVRRRMEKGLMELQSLLHQFQSGRDLRQSYHDIYKSVRETDKMIGSVYDSLGGSNFVHVVIDELRRHILEEKDLEKLSDPTREYLIRFIDS